MRIETERLVIRDLREDDWEAVHEYASNPLVAEHMQWGPNTEEETKAFLQRAILWQKEAPRTEFELAVTLRSDGRLIGGCGIHAEGEIGEIGYCFHPAYWRQGYASEAAGAMLALGFGELKLHRIFATCRPDNTGSAKVMERVGMRYEGLLREHIKAKGRGCRFKAAAAAVHKCGDRAYSYRVPFVTQLKYSLHLPLMMAAYNKRRPPFDYI